MQDVPCKIHSGALISAHPDLQGLDRRFVCGFIGASKSRIALSQFKGCCFFWHTLGVWWLHSQIWQNRLDIRYENVCLCVARGCLEVILRNSLLIVTSWNPSLVPACASFHFSRIKTEANTMWGLMCCCVGPIVVSDVLVGCRWKVICVSRLKLD